jgi:NAD-dependent SIR2 family protein deacetylase
VADDLRSLLEAGRVAVLTGAGMSTRSGIPDYRGPAAAGRPVTPITYQVFTCDDAARRRYWARSHRGWQVISRAEPNEAHAAVADLQRLGLVQGLITQNVDGLHQAGGAEDVIELHGNLDAVVCLGCGAGSHRLELAERLAHANPEWRARITAVNPDGDVDLDDETVEAFRPVDCADCGGMLKPDVVFFGETVPAPRVARAFEVLDTADALLVLGSSLTVMSGYRFVLRAAKRGLPVAIVNQGPTRGDARATVRVDGELTEVLPDVVTALAGRLGGALAVHTGTSGTPLPG